MACVCKWEFTTHRHIITKDPSLIDEYHDSEPMLVHALKVGKPWDKWTQPTKSWEKARECAQILIDAGANVNAKFKKEGTDNLLGRLIWDLTLCKHERRQVSEEQGEESASSVYDDNIMSLRRGAAFLVGNEATCHIEEIEKPQPNQDEDLLTQCVALCKNSLEEAREQALEDKIGTEWSKVRLVHLANKSDASPFSCLPGDLLALTSQHIALQHFKKS